MSKPAVESINLSDAYGTVEREMQLYSGFDALVEHYAVHGCQLDDDDKKRFQIGVESLWMVLQDLRDRGLLPRVLSC